MTCSCPKCNDQIALGPIDITAEGSSHKCSACGTNFVVQKESFALRALHKSDEIACAECGRQPGASIYCQNCHAIYPDFLVFDTSSATKRQLGRLSKALSSFNNLKFGGSAKPSIDSYNASPSKPVKSSSLQLSGKSAQVIIIMAIISLLGGGGYYWYQDKQATAFTANYVRAILGIKMARDLDLRISARIATDIKAGATAALTAAEQKSAASAKNDVDALIKRFDKVPGKFTVSNDSLHKLYAAYSELHTAVTVPLGSADIYTGTVKNIDADFRKSAQELKSGLPEKISSQLSVSSKKFKALQDF